jgi:hypothetical protein
MKFDITKKILVGDTYEFDFTVDETKRYYARYRWNGNVFERIENNELANTNILSCKEASKKYFKYIAMNFHKGEYKYLGVTSN